MRRNNLDARESGDYEVNTHPGSAALALQLCKYTHIACNKRWPADSRRAKVAHSLSVFVALAPCVLCAPDTAFDKI